MSISSNSDFMEPDIFSFTKASATSFSNFPKPDFVFLLRSPEKWPKDTDKIQVMDPAPKEDKIVPSAKKRKMAHTDFSLPDLKRVKYECNTCHRAFRSQQALGGHRSGRTRGRTCKQEENESKPFAARFNLDGYILTSNVVWAKRRRSARVFVSYFVKN